MANLDNQHMDEIFRHGAEQHDYDYNPAAWSQMEQMLDIEDSRRRRRWIVFSLLALLLFAASAYMYIRPTDGDAQRVDVADTSADIGLITTDSSAQDDAAKSSESGPGSEASMVTSDAELEASTSLIIDLPAELPMDPNHGLTEGSTAYSVPTASSTISAFDRPIPSAKEILWRPAKERQIHTDAHVNTFESTGQRTLRAASTFHSDIVSSKSASSHALVSAESGAREILFSPASLQSYGTSGIDYRHDALMAPEPSTTVKPIAALMRPGVLVSLLANPEWSSVGLQGDREMGYTMGARIGLRLTDHWVVSSGIAYSKKVYAGTGDDYTMSGGWYDETPERMDAKCEVIEIPLLAQYYLNGQRHSGFFVEAGVSSYMLHTEWYGFEYDDALTRPVEYVDITMENESKHLVGVGRLSIGYQQKLSGRTALQVAPYLQFPLTGIGTGRVNLYSTGVQVAISLSSR